MNKSLPYSNTVKVFSLSQALRTACQSFYLPFHFSEQLFIPHFFSFPYSSLYVLLHETIETSSMTFLVFSPLSYPQIQHHSLYLILRMFFILFKASLIHLHSGPHSSPLACFRTLFQQLSSSCLSAGLLILSKFLFFF